MGAIAGIYNLGNQENAEQLASMMAEKLQHRGVLLLYANFQNCSTIVLQSRALNNRPLLSNTEGIYTFTGEPWYNNKQASVDILARLYKEKGVDFVSFLSGQFAIVIYDKNKNNVLLARDCNGAEPLFWTIINKTLYFSSEIKSLMEVPAVYAERAVNMEAVDQLLTWPSVLAPHTFFQGIYSLRAGERLLVNELENGELNPQTLIYKDLTYPLLNKTTKSNAIQHNEGACLAEFDRLFQQAVANRLSDDAAFFVSGGIDSALVTNVAYALGKEDISTFSIMFTDNDIDESIWQKIVTQKINSKHYTQKISNADIFSKLPDIIKLAETPLKESYNACSLILSNMLREAGFNAVLSGEGADEFFAGYAGYLLNIQNPITHEDDLEELFENQKRMKLWGDKNIFYEKQYAGHEEMRRQLYSDIVRQNFTKFNATRKSPLDINMIKGRHPYHQRSYLDLKLRVADHLLADHGDKVMMANDITARYPFMDNNLIDFYTKLPPEFLTQDKKEKYPVRKLAEKYVPKEIIERRKFSFVAPASPELLRLKLPYVEELLSEEHIKSVGYFDHKVVQSLKKLYSDPKFKVNQTFEEDLLMFILTFHIWVEEFSLPKA